MSKTKTKTNTKNKFDGKIGKYYYRVGKVAGCFNLFRKRKDNKWKYWKSVTNVEFSNI